MLTARQEAVAFDVHVVTARRDMFDLEVPVNVGHLRVTFVFLIFGKHCDRDFSERLRAGFLDYLAFNGAVLGLFGRGLHGGGLGRENSYEDGATRKWEARLHPQPGKPRN